MTAGMMMAARLGLWAWAAAAMMTAEMMVCSMENRSFRI